MGAPAEPPAPVTDAQRLQDLVYAVSHDLRAPLRAVSGFIGIFLRRHGDTLDPAAQELIDLAADGAAVMQGMLDELLVYSRIVTTGTIVAECDLDACLQAALSDLAQPIAAAGATVEQAQRLPIVPGNAALLTDLFKRLLKNALTFAADAAPVITISLREDDDMISVAVIDHGPGIEPALVPRALELFQRLNHVDDGLAGVGMGLPIALRIAEHHGGTLSLTTPDDHAGLRAEVRLPRLSATS